MQTQSFYFITYGCKVNSCDSSAMAAAMERAGFLPAKTEREADIVIVNSCTVTAGSDQKLRQGLRALRRKNPAATLVLTGCFPQAFPEAAQALPEADIVTGTAARGALPELIKTYLSSPARTVAIAPHAGVFETLESDETLEHTRAFLKIEDGCNNYCGYCIIPYARGGVRSMPPGDVAAQAARFARGGYKEIVLSGINLSCYGQDLGLTLADAAERAAAPAEIERVRLGSIEPDRVDAALLERLAATGKLCAHFHLSLQSGCDATLARMGRRYTAAQYREVASLIRRYFPDASFTTDVMVGYPGETPQEFEQSLGFVSSFGFLKCHVFPYSRRPGTRAAEMPGQIDNATKSARAAEMAAAAEAARGAAMARWVKREVAVLLEQPQPGGSYSGYTEQYLPARVFGPALSANTIVRGAVAEIRDGYCVLNL